MFVYIIMNNIFLHINLLITRATSLSILLFQHSVGFRETIGKDLFRKQLVLLSMSMLPTYDWRPGSMTRKKIFSITVTRRIHPSSPDKCLRFLATNG